MTPSIILRRGGFTFIEMLVVLIIIGLLIGLVAPRYMGQEEKAKVKTTQAQIELLGTALDTFRLDVGRYPMTQEGLEALRHQPGGLERWDGPYIKKEVPKDPWGQPYIYHSPGEHGPYDLLSYGADKAPGGEGNDRDITSWE
jgi:general secretion pathway protein G